MPDNGSAGKYRGKAGLLDSKVLDCYETFVTLLIRRTTDTLLPELVAVFGDRPEEIVQFLSIFAGTTFRVPSVEALSNIVRDAYIHTAMENGRDTIESLAAMYDLQVADVKEILKKTRKAIAELNGSQAKI